MGKFLITLYIRMGVVEFMLMSHMVGNVDKDFIPTQTKLEYTLVHYCSLICNNRLLELLLFKLLFSFSIPSFLSILDVRSRISCILFYSINCFFWIIFAE